MPRFSLARCSRVRFAQTKTRRRLGTTSWLSGCVQPARSAAASADHSAEILERGAVGESWPRGDKGTHREEDLLVLCVRSAGIIVGRGHRAHTRSTNRTCPDDLLLSLRARVSVRDGRVSHPRRGLLPAPFHLATRPPTNSGTRRCPLFISISGRFFVATFRSDARTRVRSPIRERERHETRARAARMVN